MRYMLHVKNNNFMRNSKPAGLIRDRKEALRRFNPENACGIL